MVIGVGFLERNSLLFKLHLDDEFHTFRWEEYLRSTKTIAAPSHVFKSVRIVRL